MILSIGGAYGASTYRFGPFELDPGRRRLTRGREPVSVSDRQVDVLLLLVEHAGHIVSKDTIIDIAWRGVIVTEYSIFKAVSELRQRLGNQPDGTPYIKNVNGRGYQFAALIERGQPQPAPATGDESSASSGRTDLTDSGITPLSSPIAPS
jgi:DNA-binding winged helix-turn-helix (wHTH) protein